MDIYGSEFQEYAQARAAEILATMGYEPLRALPERAIVLPTPFIDDELQGDVGLIRGSAAELCSRLKGLDPETDRFSLVLDAGTEALEYNETLAEAQRWLQSAATQLTIIGRKFQEFGTETKGSVSLSQDDLAYIEKESAKRAAHAAHLLEYCDNPDSTDNKPVDHKGDVIDPILASGLAQQYAVDTMVLKGRLESEVDMSAIDAAGAQIGKLIAEMGTKGTAYISALSRQLERSRRSSARWRRAIITLLSLGFVGVGVGLDGILTSAGWLGHALWISVAVAVVVWLVDRSASSALERRVLVKQHNLISQAVVDLSEKLVFLRQQQASLNSIRTMFEKEPVRLSENWTVSSAA